MQRSFRNGMWGIVLLAFAATVQANGRSVETEPGVHIHYDDAGPRQSDFAILLVPGWMTAANVWDAQVRAFAERHRVIAIDPRSQGRSSLASDGNTPEARARDIDRLIEVLGLDNVVLVGWSQGVQDVLAYGAGFSSTRIAAYVLVDSMPSPGPEFVTLYPQGAQQLLSRLGLYTAHQEPYLRGMMRAIFKQPLPSERADLYVTTAMKTPTTTGLSMLISDLLTVDRRPYASKLERPTLIIASAEAEDLEQQRAMLRDLPDGRMIEIAEAGHAVFADQPKRFNAELASFLESLPRGGRGGARR